MGDKSLTDIVSEEEKKLNASKDANEKVNILYNLIVCKHKSLNQSIYIDIKHFINSYIEAAKKNDFGYDSFCIPKVLKVIDFLDCNKRIALLNYLLSTLSREFPEIDVDWVHNSISKAKIDEIITEKNYKQFPKAFLLYSSLKIHTLLITLFLFFVLIFVILLPAPFSFMELFKLEYSDYSSNFILNHLFNVMMLFSGIDDSITALNGVGVILYVIAKISFVLLIVNFVYKRISDKISLK